MTKKAKIQLTQVFNDVEEIEVVRELRALTVALQSEIQSLEDRNAQLADEVLTLEYNVEALNDCNADLKDEAEGREEDGRSRGYDDGYKDGKQDGYDEGYNEGRDFEADQGRPGA